MGFDFDDCKNSFMDKLSARLLFAEAINKILSKFYEEVKRIRKITDDKNEQKRLLELKANL